MPLASLRDPALMALTVGYALAAQGDLVQAHACFEEAGPSITRWIIGKGGRFG